MTSTVKHLSKDDYDNLCDMEQKARCLGKIREHIARADPFPSIFESKETLMFVKPCVLNEDEQNQEAYAERMLLEKEIGEIKARKFAALTDFYENVEEEEYYRDIVREDIYEFALRKIAQEFVQALDGGALLGDECFMQPPALSDKNYKKLVLIFRLRKLAEKTRQYKLMDVLDKLFYNLGNSSNTDLNQFHLDRLDYFVTRAEVHLTQKVASAQYFLTEGILEFDPERARKKTNFRKKGLGERSD